MKVKNSNANALQGQQAHKSVFNDMNVLNEILRERTREREDSAFWSNPQH